jgi:HAD superfamily phosphoserine phosphatase-like hydrolase
MQKIEAVVFDIDGTLTEDISWTALTRDLGGSVEDHMAIFNAFREGRIDYPTSKYQLIRLWQATGNANKAFIEHLFTSWPIRLEAPALMRWLLDENYTLGLITGSLDLYAKAIAGRLGIENYYANTELIFDAQDNLVDFHYELNQAKKKVEQLQAFCESKGITIKGCVVVGDGDNDLELFRETGRGVLVGDAPSRELVESAWKRIGSLSEIKGLLSP